MNLPLLEKVKEGDLAFHLTSAQPAKPTAGKDSCRTIADVIPANTPGPGEQYRFHFDMTKCIGCKCCVVACNEQNGNPAEIQWRRVGEIEGGFYPETHRHYLSMGCNHCVDPSCLTGCPVDAYSKDPVTGIVRHNADACIGCQYCTWNCSYGVPQYNAERGVVGKCDMCYGRLTQGQEPACAFACPEGAIQIEIVNVHQWRREYASSANAPGMPSADDTLSTTRITQPKDLPRNIQKVNLNWVRLEHPHWPLVFMTILTQFSVGAFAAVWLFQSMGVRAGLRMAGAASLTAALIAMGASTLHLGRPIHAYRAIMMWRRSWLSREVLLFSIFAIVASLCAATIFLELRVAVLLAALTVLAGTAGIGASARIYLVPGRPAWNTSYTVLEFALTSIVLGSFFAAALSGGMRGTRLAAVASAAAVLLTTAAKLLWLLRSQEHELQATARLLTTVLANRILCRVAFMGAAILLVFQASSKQQALAALLLAAASEFLGRYIFFVSVVPTNIAAGYLAAQEAA